MNRREIEIKLKENKSEKKELKKKLAELPKFENGKWYSGDNHLIYLVKYNVSNSKIYGFYDGNWRTSETFNVHYLKESTEQEVFEALKNEAIKRGYKEGDVIKSMRFSGNWVMDSHGLSLYCNQLFMGGSVIFIDGKWAKIIKQPTVNLNGSYSAEQLQEEIVKLNQ
tara:strand:+ start:252 stop:752 length:501 start_codon:yes stop_codon:yes gene_type:complete